MQLTAQTIRTEELEHLQFTAVNTTLDDLIEVIGQEIKPSESGLVSAIVSDMFDRGLIGLSDSMGKAVTNFSLN